MSSTVRFSRAPSTTGRRPGSGSYQDPSSQLADKALAAFVIIHAMLKRSRRLQTFCERSDIKARFPGYAVRRLSCSQGLPTPCAMSASSCTKELLQSKRVRRSTCSRHSLDSFSRAIMSPIAVSPAHQWCRVQVQSAVQVRMGFGLHVGWAIEGAIGSEYKIDASYLSPNVNMASRLEAATKQFGTTILLSDHFIALLSPSVRRRVRQVLHTFSANSAWNLDGQCTMRRR